MSRTRINEAEYKRIKALLDAGVTPSQTAKVTSRSLATVHRIASSADHASYKREIVAVASKYNAKRKAGGSPTKEALESLREKLPDAPAEKAIPDRPRFDENGLQLKRIADALERLADAWEASPKRRLF